MALPNMGASSKPPVQQAPPVATPGQSAGPDGSPMSGGPQPGGGGPPGAPDIKAIIGQTAKGWNISSYINFKALRRRESIAFRAMILNIQGEGSTLEDAVKMFSANFKAKIYDGDETNKMAVQPSENLMGVVLPPDWLR